MDTIFLLISAYCTYLFLELCGVVLIGGWLLKKRDIYFKVREIIHTEFQNFIMFSFQETINNCCYLTVLIKGHQVRFLIFV